MSQTAILPSPESKFGPQRCPDWNPRAMNDSYITFSALIPLHRLSFLIYEVAVRLWWDPEVLGAHSCHQTSGLGAGLQRSLVVVWIWVRYGLCFPSSTSLRAPCLGQGMCSRSARSVRLGWRNWRAEQSGALWEIGLHGLSPPRSGQKMVVSETGQSQSGPQELKRKGSGRGCLS